ncbi:MAG: ABC transporter permease, partial [bacterium]|nr:ABC transporter permease [bacterium]
TILTNREEFSDGFAANRYRAIVAIAPGFGEDIATHRDARFQVIVDGSDANSANVISNHIKAISQQISLENVAKRFGKKPEPPIELKTRIWYNEEMRSPVFIVPGLVALFLVMLCALLTSVAVAREKEFGTLEQVLTTPVHPAEVIIGKVLPYMGIAIIDTVLVIGIGIILFDVPLRGSVLALCGYSVVYLLVALGMGLLISVSVKTQQLALMVALMVTMIPTLLLSGLIFPIASMPLPLQILSNIVPARWYIEIVRGIMLKGENYYPIQAAVLTVMAVVTLAISIKKFRSQMGGV